MKEILSWLNDALASKDLVRGMNYYRVADGQIKATDGRITAAHPWPYNGEFLAPGDELEKILTRCAEDPTITIASPKEIRIRSGRFHGTIQTLPLTEWDYPGVDEAQWKPLPTQLMEVLHLLRPFISDNAVQGWAMSVALENGWAYATNNVSIGGAKCKGLNGVNALLPVWALDFVLPRTDGLTHWAWTDNYVAFKWNTNAWMRSQLVVGQFPEKASQLAQAAFQEEPTQVITEEFRAAFRQIAELAADTVSVYADRIESKFGKAIVVDGAESEVPEGALCSIWGAKFLLPALEVANCWSPAMWPKPAPFKGPVIAGYVVGRKP